MCVYCGSSRLGRTLRRVNMEQRAGGDVGSSAGVCAVRHREEEEEEEEGEGEGERKAGGRLTNSPSSCW